VTGGAGGRYIALLRGINVGTAGRIAMADLRALVSDLGYSGVRTHLQSGNVVFDAESAVTDEAVRNLEAAIIDRTGVSSRVVLVPAVKFRRIARDNPLADAPDPSRMVVTFLDAVPPQESLVRPTDAELLPERLVFGAEAIYQWCPDGVLKTKLPPRFFAKLAPVTTARNLRTVTKLVAMLDE
jgi:uncharacterized protein (DUF1697 family)